MSDPVAVRAALERLGARRLRPRHFEDNLLYDDPQGALSSRGQLLRLRRAEGVGVLTFKGPRVVSEGIKSREEIELTIEQPEPLHELLSRLGLEPAFRYQKYRESYGLGDLEVVLDETPIGTFLELEGPAEQIHRWAGELGYSRADYVADSYAELFRASGAGGDMVFEKGE